ncbi:MAG: LLM class flavin-dependent oxidoreductase [Actinomycetota bacterium]|nr:LLM class flavin-dependent oxidoreductase [Actinomycetota bacterium]
MPTTFGVHTGPSGTTVDELRDLWRRIEEMPFDWISIWDHFYSADGRSTNCLESVAMHTALALTTERVRCGSLVYCAAYRHPAVLANAMATIDHLSGGRCDVGIGAGWLVDEYEAHGFRYPRAAERLDIMEESIRCVRGLLREPSFSFEGEHFTLNDAVCDPAPLQSELPIWVGGGGERRTLRIAAELADGWNVPFLDPETFAHKRSVLHSHCADAGRDPSEITCSINVGFAADEASLHQQFGEIAEFVRPGVLVGTGEQLVDAIGQYVAAGADQVNIAVRAPYSVESLEIVADAVAAVR